MFTNLKPYPAYRSSPVSWATRLPSHWQVRRGRTLFTRMNRPVRNDDGVVTCFRDGIVTLRSKRRTSGFTEALQEIGYQGIRTGDLVIHAMDAFAGAVGVSDSDGKGTPVYAVCRPLGGAQSRYFAALVREMARSSWIAALSRGVRERSTDFRFEAFAVQEMPVPPTDEQAAIVKYLGHANARIDRAIAAKRRLIALLEEQKRAVINQAVTHGLDPVVAMKDSGIPWLGPIPVHWNVRRAKYLFRDIDARSETGLEEQLSVSHLTGVTPRRLKNITMFKAASYVGHKTCRAGDLVVNTMWAWMGALGCAREAGLVSPAYNVYRPLQGSGADTEFVGALFRTPTYIAYFRSNSTGVRASRLRFYPDELLATPVVLPPRDEQAEIVLAIEDLRGRVAADLEKVVREIELLREFRTRLTADVVTGQLDVREAAARLPELDLAELVSDVGEQDEDDLDAELADGLEAVDA